MNFAAKSRILLTALVLSAASAQVALADKITLPTETVVAAADAPADAAVTINIKSMKYDQPEVTIKAGQTITWVNTEAMPHNVAFKAGAVGDDKLDGPMMKKDQAFSITFNDPGTYDYHCTPHPFMKGKVIVE